MACWDIQKETEKKSRNEKTKENINNGEKKKWNK